MEAVKNLLYKIQDLWKKLGITQRWVIGAVTVVLLLFFSSFLFFAGKDNYTPLFSGLELNDQAAIVELLKEKGVDYKLAPSSSAILVPESSVYNLRLTMASSGLPRNGTVGYEIFDDTKMGMTDFQQQVAYVRALEGELARTISRLEVIESARVSVVLPKQKLFLKEQEPATASVLVKLRPGRQMKVDQVKAVMKLVASSIEGLKPENVSLVDTSGRLLSELAGDGYLIHSGSSGSVSSVQRELERHHEIEVQKKIQNMLSAIFGQGNTVVRINVELDFTRSSSKKHEYIPQSKGKGIVRSVQNNEESYTGSTQSDQGVGTASNIPGYAVKTSGSNNGEYNKTDEVINYEISSMELEEEKSPGTIKRITASVVINAKESSIHKEELLASLSAAIGINKERGDILSLSFMPFASPDRSGTLPQGFEERTFFERSLVPSILIVAFLTLIIIFLARHFKKNRDSSDSEEKLDQDPEDVAKLWDVPKDEMQILEEQVELYAETYPDEVAGIIKKWLEES